MDSVGYTATGRGLKTAKSLGKPKTANRLTAALYCMFNRRKPEILKYMQGFCCLLNKQECYFIYFVICDLR